MLELAKLSKYYIYYIIPQAVLVIAVTLSPSLCHSRYMNWRNDRISPSEYMTARPLHVRID
jgi:hypothetical protein